MSEAIQRNAAAANRERERRLAATFRGEMPIGSLAVTGDQGWDAFWGSLVDKREAANAAGMGFRGDLSGIGRWAGGDEPAQPSANQINYGLGRLADENAARQLALQDYAQKKQAEAVDDMRRSYDEHVLASVGQPRMSTAKPVQTTDANGRPVYTLRADEREAAQTPRERLIAGVPGSMRPQVEAALTPLELAERKQKEVERAAKAEEALIGGSTLSEDAITENARRFMQTGVMPTLGMGDKTSRQRILNRAAELSGGDTNIAANTANYKADSTSLTKLQQQRDAVGAFEETALKNLDVFLDLAKKIPDTGSPALNTPIRALSEKGLGSADLAAYNAARRTVIPEFAKILTNPNLSGQLSDSARHEVEEVLNGNATLKQTMAVADLLKRDATNRRTSYDDQLATIRDRIKAGGATGGDKPPSAGAPKADDYRKKYDY